MATVLGATGYVIGRFTAAPVYKVDRVGGASVAPTPPSSTTSSLIPVITVAPTSSALAGSSNPAGSTDSTSVYLSNIQPIDDGQALTSPTDDTISGVNYPNSFQQSASGGSGTTTVWDSEHYTAFTAEVGFDDSAVGGAGQTFTVIFRNQSSQQLLAIHVSVGAPVRVNIPLRGATRLEIVCIGSNMPITFGNAQFIP